VVPGANCEVLVAVRNTGSSSTTKWYPAIFGFKEAERMDINLVFEGGGVKGIALVGALKKFEEAGVNAVGVAGTSAGSVVAALYAAGYSSDDMKDLLTKTSFSDFLDASWPKWFGLWHNFGLYRGRRLYAWVYDLLRKKGVTNFRDAKRELVVIASNLTSKEILVFNKVENPSVAIAEAVRMSSGIPLFFHAYKWGESLVVDGGLLSNYPVWAFANSKLPTFGFKLVSDAGGKVPEPPNSFPAYLSSLLSTMLDAHDKKDERVLGADRTVHIPTGSIATTNFSLTQAEKDSLYNSGYVAASQFIQQKNPFAAPAPISAAATTPAAAPVARVEKPKNEKVLFAESLDRLRNVDPELMEKAFKPLEIRRQLFVEQPDARVSVEEDLLNESGQNQSEVLRWVVSDAPIDPKELHLHGTVTIDEKLLDAAMLAEPEEPPHKFRIRIRFNGPVVASGRRAGISWGFCLPRAVPLNEDYFVFPVNHFRWPVPILDIKATFSRRDPVDKSFFAVSEEGLRPLTLTGPGLSENGKGKPLYTHEVRVEPASGLYVLRWRFE